MKNLAVVMLDNVDSFTYNLVDELRTLDIDMHIYRNTVHADTIIQVLHDLNKSSDVLLLLSPGPGAPHEAGCMLELLQKVSGHFPVLGICLGHQAIVEHFGGIISRAEAVMHGKSSDITHCGDKMFSGFAQPLPVARYHSLMASSVPDPMAFWISTADLDTPSDRTSSTCFCKLRMAAAAFLPASTPGW